MLLMENMELIVELFDIVDKSIKMVVDLYYEYGSRDEQFDSDMGDESDDEDQSYDENQGDD